MKNIFLAFFVFLTVCVYFPSLKHAPKHDQIAYLAEMAGRGSAWDKTFGAYSLNRDRQFMSKHDELLFRPLLNIFLGFQLVLFGYNFTFWQAMALLLHLLAGCCMYRLLDAIRPGVPAAWGAGFFLLMLAGVPMVIWHHISAYILFCCLILEAMLRMLRYFRDRSNTRALKECVLFCLAASFFFEAGILVMLIFALYFFFDERARASFLMFISAVVGCLAINIGDFLLRVPQINSESSNILFRIFSLDTWGNAFLALKWFLCSGVFTTSADVILVERVALSPFTISWGWPFNSFSPYLFRGFVSILFCMGILLFSWRSVSREQKKFAMLLAVMAASFVLVISAGRVNTRGVVTGLFFNSYYVYVFWALFLPAVYALFSYDLILFSREGGIVRALCYFLCGAGMFFNALAIFNVNNRVAGMDRTRRTFLDTTTAFVDAHRLEPGFSFYIPHGCPGNYAGKWLHKQTDPLWRRYTLSEALYPYFYTLVDPKYVMSCHAQADPREGYVVLPKKSK
ncbi:MAG: hypothetical protein HQL19_07640 [Candidatus Omnitrophica bacterium]|nr:hypothetical protein [Candidatus Omnitrophota bacterium]